MRYNVSRGAFLKKMHEREGAIVIQVNDTLIHGTWDELCPFNDLPMKSYKIEFLEQLESFYCIERLAMAIFIVQNQAAVDLH